MTEKKVFHLKMEVGIRSINVGINRFPHGCRQCMSALTREGVLWSLRRTYLLHNVKRVVGTCMISGRGTSHTMLIFHQICMRKDYVDGAKSSIKLERLFEPPTTILRR